MKFLVTGAAGFLGSHLCDVLLREGHIIVGIDNFFRGKKENLPKHPNFSFQKCDLLNLSSLCEIVKTGDFDVVIHYAAINGTRYFYDIPYKVCNDNITMTQNLLAACEGTDIQRVVYASSSEVYGPTPIVPTSEEQPIILHAMSDRDSYASSKAMGEFLVRLWSRQNEKDFLIVRPFNTYGSRMATNGYGQVIPEFIERVYQDGQFYLYGDGKQTRSFCHVQDHCEIVVRLINLSAEGVYNIGFDEETTILDLARLIHNLSDKKFSVKFKPAWGNDTKWRKPDLEKLNETIGDWNYTLLEDGIRSLMI